MQKKTKSILEELEQIHAEKHVNRDRDYIVESRGSNVISSAIRLVEHIESQYSEEEAANLIRKLLNSIRDKQPGKFARAVRRIDK